MESSIFITDAFSCFVAFFSSIIDWAYKFRPPKAIAQSRRCVSLIYEAPIQFGLPPPVVPMGKVAPHFLSKISCAVRLGALRQPPLSALATIFSAA